MCYVLDLILCVVRNNILREGRLDIRVGVERARCQPNPLLFVPRFGERVEFTERQLPVVGAESAAAGCFGEESEPPSRLLDRISRRSSLCRMI